MKNKIQIEIGDKLLCKKTHYDNKGVHIWQIGKNYEVIFYNYDYFHGERYSLKNEQYIDSRLTIKELESFFLINEKKIRKFKLLKIIRNEQK